MLRAVYTPLGENVLIYDVVESCRSKRQHMLTYGRRCQWQVSIFCFIRYLGALPCQCCKHVQH